MLSAQLHFMRFKFLRLYRFDALYYAPYLDIIVWNMPARHINFYARARHNNIKAAVMAAQFYPYGMARPFI